MTKMTLPKKLSEVQMQKYLEIDRIYKSLYRELEILELEGRKIKKEIKAIIDKAKMRNILQDILNQPE